jgi:hypothetical protein
VVVVVVVVRDWSTDFIAAANSRLMAFHSMALTLLC